MSTPANIARTLLDRHVEEGRADRPCVRTFDRDISYAEMLDAACRAANVFAGAGVDWETRVALILPDGPDLIATVLGLWRIGAVPVPLSNQLSADDHMRVVADCRPVAAVVSSAHLPVMEQARKRCSFPRATWVCGAPVAGHDRWEQALAAASASCGYRRTSIDDMALIQYTSGSTGEQKGVVHLHRGLLAVLDGFPSRIGLSPTDVCFSAAKMSFGYGFGNSLLFPFAVGATAALLGPAADGLRVLDALQRLRPTVLFAVPSMYAALLAVAGAHPEVTLPGLRACVSAGEPLLEHLAARWHDRFGLPIINGLGATECLHIFLAARPGTPASALGTVVPGYRVRLTDESGREAGLGQAGRLWVSGEANAARYWNRHPQTIATMVGAWTRTDDLLYRDEAGTFFYLARADDVLLVGGHKVAPTEIEGRLLAHPSVGECAVIGVAGDDGVTALHAYIRPVAGITPGAALRKELAAHVRAGLGPGKCPKFFEFVTELPRTSTGKISRHLLRLRAGPR